MITQYSPHRPKPSPALCESAIPPSRFSPFNFCEHLRPSVGDMTSPLVRFARPSFIVVRLPGVSAPTRFRLDDKGTLCTLPERHSRRSRSSDEIETGVAIPHPVYKFTDQRIDWGADAPTPDSVATPPDRSRAVPDPPARSVSAPEEQASQPVRQCAPPVARHWSAPSGGTDRALRIVAASSPFNPDGPFRPGAWSRK